MNYELTEIVLKVLDYAIAHIDKVICSDENNLEVSMDDLEVSVFNDYFMDTDKSKLIGFGVCTNQCGYRRGTHKRIEVSEKDFNLVKYKLAHIAEMFLNHRIIQVIDVLNSKDSKVITTLQDIDF